MNPALEPTGAITAQPSKVFMCLAEQAAAWNRALPELGDNHDEVAKRLAPNIADRFAGLGAVNVATAGSHSTFALRHSRIAGDPREVELGLVWGAPVDRTVDKKTDLWVFRPLARYEDHQQALAAAHNTKAVGATFLELDEIAEPRARSRDTMPIPERYDALLVALTPAALAKPFRFNPQHIHMQGAAEEAVRKALGKQDDGPEMAV